MKLELLGVKLPEQDKEILRQVAERNRLTMSDIARLLITDGIEHFKERNVLKV
ncbi:MAG: hypothetical protein QG591_2570 [Planctomycetota bacterium]|nr:hypothetical protein [Planctomycetota bacterium]